MNFKHPLFIIGILLLILELITLVKMPIEDTYALNEGTDPMDLSYVPYMVVALTSSFFGAVTILIAGIVFILKSSVKKNLHALITMLIVFIIPIIAYQTLFH